MLTLVALASPAFALDVLVNVVPPEGRSAHVSLAVEPGVERVVEVPCAKAAVCRLGVTVTPESDQWLVSIRVDEVRRGVFGRETTSFLAHPTFKVATEQFAEFFMGGEVLIEGTNPVAWREDGLHIQTRVSTVAPG